MAASLTGTFGHATGTQDAGRPHRCRHDRATQLVPAGDAPAAARDKRCPPLPRWQERDAAGAPPQPDHPQRHTAATGPAAAPAQASAKTLGRAAQRKDQL